MIWFPLSLTTTSDCQGFIRILESISSGRNNHFLSNFLLNFHRFWAPHLPDQFNIFPTVIIYCLSFASMLEFVTIWEGAGLNFTLEIFKRICLPCFKNCSRILAIINKNTKNLKNKARQNNQILPYGPYIVGDTQ